MRYTDGALQDESQRFNEIAEIGFIHVSKDWVIRLLEHLDDSQYVLLAVEDRHAEEPVFSVFRLMTEGQIKVRVVAGVVDIDSLPGPCDMSHHAFAQREHQLSFVSAESVRNTRIQRAAFGVDDKD